MPLKKNRTLSKTKRKERKVGSKLKTNWRDLYSKSYYFDNEVKPYDTLVGDIQDAYLLLYEHNRSAYAKPFYKRKKYTTKYDLNVIGILKVLHRFYDYTNIKVTNKNLIIARGLAFDTESKYYKKWVDSFPFSRTVVIPNELPTPYKNYFDSSSKDNREEREKQINNYSFGKLERRIKTIELKMILWDLALEIQNSVGAKNSLLLRASSPFMEQNGKEKHLFKLFDGFIMKIIDKKKNKVSEEKYNDYKKMIKQRRYFDILGEKILGRYRAKPVSTEN